MTVIDVHCHIYPEKIHVRAIESVGKFYNVPMQATGATGNDLLAVCAESPITHHVVHSVAVKPDTVESINSFIASEFAAHPQFIGFATMHQDYAYPEEELLRAQENGLVGIKLHPDTQAVNMDDPRLMKVYAIAEELGMPIIMHCGDYRFDFSHPRRLKHILDTFPHLVVDAAHFGGWSVWDDALDILGNERCFVDMSSSLGFMESERVKELTHAYGTDRVLFGSDFPMWNPVEEYNKFTQLGFSDAQLEDMLFNNALRFLGEAS